MSFDKIVDQKPAVKILREEYFLTENKIDELENKDYEKFAMENKGVELIEDCFAIFKSSDNGTTKTLYVNEEDIKNLNKYYGKTNSKLEYE